MTEPAPGAAPEPVTETWTYGGIRADKDGKKWHAWADAAGEEHWFARTGGRMAVGSHYTAQVTRRDGGGITLHGTPEYAGTQAGQETRAALWTEHTLAQTRIEIPARRAGRRPPQRPGRGDRPAPGTGRPAAHRRPARRAGRLRHPQAPQHLEHPEAPGRPAIERRSHMRLSVTWNHGALKCVQLIAHGSVPAG